MALADIEAELTGTVPHRVCSVCYWMEERGDVWANKLRSLLANRGVRFKDLAEKLAKDPDEPDIPAHALSRHAQCGCAAQERLR